MYRHGQSTPARGQVSLGGGMINDCQPWFLSSGSETSKATRTPPGPLHALQQENVAQDQGGEPRTSSVGHWKAGGTDVEGVVGERKGRLPARVRGGEGRLRESHEG